nr:ATP-binding cassette domain-containing protein [Thiocapsa imhoffii]
MRLDRLHSRLLEPLDLLIEAGALLFLSGASGSGKSQLLRAIADLDPHTGEVWLGDTPRSRMPPALWRRRVGLLPAETCWWAEEVGAHLPLMEHASQHPLSLGSNTRASPPAGQPIGRVLKHLAAFTRRSRPRQSATGTAHEPEPASATPSQIIDWLARIGFEPDVLGWSIARLSSGERQRLALVRLLAQMPTALLLDEPTANLDPGNGARVESLVTHYRQQQQVAILWVSHDPLQRARLGGRALAIRNARLEPVA